jgi:probable HAF family extracellular repeat protein
MTRRLSSALVVLYAAVSLAACDPTSVIEDLGTLGGPTSIGLGINAAGNVCGGSFLGTDPHTSGLHAFRYVDGLGMIDAGALPPHNISEAHGINSGGLMVGGSMVEGFVSHAFIASATLNLRDLGTLGGEYSYAWDLNDAGVVTGEASNAALDTHAFTWTSSGGMRDLGTLGGTSSVGRSINEAGQVGGESRIGTGTVTRAFRFTEGVGMISLGTLPGGSSSSAYGINNSGQVVGDSETSPIVDPTPRLKDSVSARPLLRLKGFPLSGIHAFLWTEGVGMTDLGHLGGGTSVAFAINNNGIVVGKSARPDGAERAFRWTQAQGMIDLNTLLPRNSGWVLTAAWDVNDRGQIAGEGLHNGVLHAFRLNPPELVDEVSRAKGTSK